MKEKLEKCEEQIEVKGRNSSIQHRVLSKEVYWHFSMIFEFHHKTLPKIESHHEISDTKNVSNTLPFVLPMEMYGWRETIASAFVRLLN